MDNKKFLDNVNPERTRFPGEGYERSFHYTNSHICNDAQPEIEPINGERAEQ
jgi:hypothetical protein